jgi:hypothetical protein
MRSGGDKEREEISEDKMEEKMKEKRNIEYILSFSVARRNYFAKHFYLKKLNKTKRSYLFILKHKIHS